MALERLGKYRIIEELGRGGMGIVYRGHDEVIGRDVAIKVIHEHAKVEEESLTRFYREARSAGRLTHESITTVYDVAEENSVPYLVMELLDGSSLRQLVSKGRPPLDKALDFALQVARGLQYAHSRSVVHRDIKPANIQITSSGRAKIMDFGIARLESEGTATQSSLGTPSYMSPEQIRETAIDQRTDVFSFGVVLYEMLTGSNPFVAENVTGIVYRVLHVDPDPPELPSDLDTALATDLQHIVARCLVKDPQQRYPGFEEILRDLQVVYDRLRGVLSGETVIPDDLRTLRSGDLRESMAAAADTDASGQGAGAGAEESAADGLPGKPRGRLSPAWVAGGIAVVVIALIASWGLQKRFETTPEDSPPMSRRMAEAARDNMFGAWGSIDESRLTDEGRRTLDEAKERATDGDEFLTSDRYADARQAFRDANQLLVRAAQQVRSDTSFASGPSPGTGETPGEAPGGTPGDTGQPGQGDPKLEVDDDGESELEAQPLEASRRSGSSSGSEGRSDSRSESPAENPAETPSGNQSGNQSGKQSDDTDNRTDSVSPMRAAALAARRNVESARDRVAGTRDLVCLDRAFTQADQQRLAALRDFDRGDFSSAASGLQDAQRAFEDLDRQLEQRKKAEQARESMKSARGAAQSRLDATPDAGSRAPEATGAFGEGERAREDGVDRYESCDFMAANSAFTRAESHFRDVPGLLDQAPDPSELVSRAAVSVLADLKTAMLEGDWTGLPGPVTDYYKRQRDRLTKEFDITRVMVEHTPPVLEGEAARMHVTLSIFFQQKGTETLQSVPVERDWNWSVRDGNAFVTGVDG